MLRFVVPVVVPAGLARALHTQAVRVVSIIPARFRSTRLPGKALALVSGKPLDQFISVLTFRRELAEELDR